MGKASKKMKRKQDKKQQSELLRQNSIKEEQFIQEYQEGRYEKALESLAQLIEGQDIKPNLLYYGACCYYGLADYERAAKWVTNTLNYAPGHIDARLLLAKICIVQQHFDDAVALLDFVVGQGGLSAEQQVKVRRFLEDELVNETDRIRLDFPRLAKLLPVKTENNVEAEKPQDVITALQNLKQRVCQLNTDEDKAEKVQTSSEAEQKKAEVLAQNVSLVEKIRLLNVFASGYYMQDDYNAAQLLLKAALELDDREEATLRNLAMTMAALGEKDKAAAITAKMAHIDFVLVQAIKDR